MNGFSEKNTEYLKSLKEIQKHKIRLTGGNQELPLNFLWNVNCPFFFVLFSDRVLIYKYEEVSQEKEKIRTYITLNFANQTELQELYLVFSKDKQYLLFVTIVGIFLITSA